MTVRQLFADTFRRLEKLNRVIVVLLNARRHREDIGVEDDVFRREAHFVDQNVVGPLADLELAIRHIRLAVFVKRHDHGSRAIAADLLRRRHERLLAFLQRDRIDDRLALHAFETSLDHRPFGRVDHHRHLGDVRLRRDEVQKAHHGGFRIQHRLVHVDVDDLRPALDLIAGHVESCVVIAFDNQPLELGRAGDIRPFTDIDEGPAAGGTCLGTHSAAAFPKFADAVKGSSPDRRIRFSSDGILRGVLPSTARAMALI